MPGGTFIHPTSIVENGAQLGERVRIGPFCHVSANAVLGDDVQLMSHVSVMGITTLGSGTSVYPHAVLGGGPQSTGHKGGPTKLTIGRNCTIREFVTMNAGTDFGRGETVIGNGGHFLAYTHIAHDCVIGDNVTFANGATLGGHCEIGDRVGIGGLTAVHQFVRVGRQAFLGGCSAILGDVAPYAIAVGNRAKLRGLNVVGLRRSGMAATEIRALRAAFKMIFDRSRPVAQNLEEARAAFAGSAAVATVIDFLSGGGKRRLTTPPLRAGDDDDDDGDDSAI
jgi:UDP-N-acetylglucosamine acyltransferase